MARVTHVKKAQQRYQSVPVIDPATGQQKKTPVMRKDGTQKTTKTGRPVFLSVTMADKTKPLPNHKCERCSKEIKVGDPYQHVSPKAGPYGGVTRYRCADCPTWQHWELSSSKRATIWQAQSEFDVTGCETIEDINQALTDFAEVVREVAGEYEESADNIEDGFGHSTYQSDELREQQEALESWADDLDSGLEDSDDDWPKCDLHEGGQMVRYFIANKDDGSAVSEDEYFDDADEAQTALDAMDDADDYEVAEESVDVDDDITDACDDCQSSKDDWLDEKRSEAEEKINEEP